MAAYAALASLMNSIDQITNHPRLSACLDTQQIRPLLDTAGLLLDFIEGYSHGGVTSKEVEDLERRIASAAHAAEDVIESSVVDQIRAGTNVASLRFLFHMQQTVEEMDAVLEKTNELKEKAGLRLREEEDEQPTHSRIPLMDHTRETAMVGFEDELIQIMDVLTNQQSSRHVISIVGMGGSGKTTLARNLYQNLLIKQHFDIRAWASVSQQQNVREILSQLLSRQEDPSQRSVDALGEELYKSLSGRRYLIVLDDVWSVEAWDEVRHFFPDNRNRSRVVLTTRLSNVARDCLSSSCFSMKPLDEIISWKLFCRKAFEQENCPYPELEEVGKEIVRLCRGLPLSTVVIGGLLLKSPRSLEFWGNVVRNIKSNPYSEEKQESLDILSLSYHHLPPHLKPCFLYMGVFDEDSVIRVSEIINLWVAEGFIRPNNTQILEEVAKDHLQELIDRNLVLAWEIRNNGLIGSCGIHDLVRDLCLKVGEQQGFLHTAKNELRGTEHGIVSIHSPVHGLSLANSILSDHSLLNPARRKLLRVRVARYCNRRTLPGIADNMNLRYLGCTLGNIKSSELILSSSLKWNLQTLNISIGNSWSHSLVVAPTEIWKIGQLRHVKCSRIYMPSDNGLAMMDKLQTLATAVNFRLSEHVCEMIPNIRKLRLLYQRSMHGYDDDMIKCVPNVHRLHKLKSLNLRIVGSSRLVIESEVNKKLAFPASLNKLCLSGCQLEWEDMSKIASLPRLEVLELGISSVMVGSKWSLVDEKFMGLKYLKIDWCNLHCWEADNSHFPVLEKLILSGLRQLEEIPWGIGEIPTIEFVRVEHCSESAAVSAVRIKEDQLGNQGDDDLQVQLKIPVAEVESFKERVEAEGLTLDHVHVERLGRDDR